MLAPARCERTRMRPYVPLAPGQRASKSIATATFKPDGDPVTSWTTNQPARAPQERPPGVDFNRRGVPPPCSVATNVSPMNPWRSPV